MPPGKRRSDLPSWLPDKRPPDVEAEYQPCCDGCRICFPIRFAGGHAMFVYLSDREFTRRTDVHIQGHILHAFRAFFRNIPGRTSGIDRGVWCFHADPIFAFLIQDNAFDVPLLYILFFDGNPAVDFPRIDPILDHRSLFLLKEHARDAVFLGLKAVGGRCFSL